ncbi:TPA: Tn3 family transposase [Legionella pneumophila]|jgi:TnpA family transposase|uniref:Transposase and inactivated derivatives, TnpA family n=1 Tax=Fluoribacter dumoffii TaxID=463 RepID=A0A377ITL2_9GAMM|nr:MULTISPECIES: Tn3 family transposase [Legionellaceae]MBN9231303.1 Tn3 family transposase [Legionella sp.]MCA0402515.1 Tn3 family transposase [Pseudomonadota bacterium]MBN9227983.1 Tn3 family transposase [Legionella steelei]OJW12716.1 MAG: DDE transposase [Legionella sp. 39-23]STO91541.1 Transposase and inactivated derivatives, TnpA family [Fluoribacter dumoffii]
MPVDFLSPAQRENYGRYPNDLAPEFIANYFFLDDQDREWIRNKRGAFSRLGYALQLTTARFVGTFYSDLTEIPYKIIERIATQINVADIQNSLERYQKSEQRWRHTVEIRTRYGFTEFNEEGIRFKLGRWLYALFWTGTDRPGLLFEQTVLWLINNKVLLPGITTVERFIAEIRSRMDTRLWRSLIKNLTNDQTEKLNNLLLVAEKQRQSLLDILRKGPVRASSKTLVKALKRIEMARELSIVLPKRLPEGRVSVLSRFANTAKTTAISRLSYERKMATLVAFAHHFEATAQDDALDILSIVLSELFSKAKRTNHKTRLRTIKDLDSAAATLIDACKVVLDNNLTDQEVRSKIFNIVGYEELIIAVTEVNALIQPPDDVFYRELEDKEQTIKNFLPSLLRVIHFDSNEAGKPIIQALDWLKSKSKKEAPMDLVSKTWKRYIHDKENQFNKTAYIFCVLDKLQGALKRRDLFISPSWRYSDPRANLHGGTEWEAIRPVICRSLNLTNEPHGYLQEFVNELDETYKLVAKNFDNNPFIRFDLIKGSEELILTQLDKLDEPESLKLLRSEVKSRLPRVDLPEVLLEIAKRTNFISAFTHINEGNARAVDLEISICAVLLAQACNTGLEPFVREDIPALKRDRLIWVDQNYIRDETITASNAILVAAQNQSKLAKKWGGGDIASADGMRFVVPVRSLHAAPNPKYFNQGRGVTWYNLLSNQRTGLNDVTVPGTLRDSLILLGVVLEQQTELKPTRIMTDTGAYSDIVFGLFRLLGYRFSPRLADLGDARFWRVDPLADYGKLNILAKHRANLERIIPHWDDVLRLVGSLKLGRVPATGIMRTLQVGDKPTRLAQAIAEIGRIDKTIHMLNYIHDESCRRSTLLQLNLTEGRHSLARSVFHGKRGELHQRYREGQEDQLGALGLVLNVLVHWNTIYMDATLDQLKNDNFPVNEEDEVRLSPFAKAHFNMLGRYSFSMSDEVKDGKLRSLRDPNNP